MDDAMFEATTVVMHSTPGAIWPDRDLTAVHAQEAAAAFAEAVARLPSDRRSLFVAIRGTSVHYFPPRNQR
jgi:DNA-directed RNA polymerase specialized sigma24 family protein